MAERTLRLIFENSNTPSKTVTISVPLADDTKNGADVKAAMDAIYANRNIFNLDLGAVKSAAFVTPLHLDYVDFEDDGN